MIFIASGEWVAVGTNNEIFYTHEGDICFVIEFAELKSNVALCRSLVINHRLGLVWTFVDEGRGRILQ